MFVKPFRTKTNVKIRGSDRKNLRSEIEKSFRPIAIADEESLSSIATNKNEINVLKIYTHKKDVATVYMINKSPLFFEVDKTLYPTVYFLWKYQEALPYVTTSTPVISKLANGADLMHPGIFVPYSENLPTFFKGSTIAINTESTMSALAVGIALKSSEDIFHSADRQGKAVQVLHVFGDHLWEAGEQLQPPKKVHPTLPTTEKNENHAGMVENDLVSKETEPSAMPSIDNSPIEKPDLETAVSSLSIAESEAVDADFLIISSANQILSEVDNSTALTEPSALANTEADENMIDMENSENAIEKMNVLLHNCAFTALKVKLKDKDLPIPTGTFYRSMVLSCCPASEFLDIKKTSYKKLGKYLKYLEEGGVMEMKELTKGVDHIISVNRTHPDLKSFEPIPAELKTSSDDVNTESQFGVLTQKHYEPPEIKLLYGVNSATSQFFNAIGYSKGAVMDTTQIRQLVTNYVRENELISEKFVTLDPLLHNIMFGKGDVDTVRVKWDALFNRLFSSMQDYYQLQFKGTNPIVKKGLPPRIAVKLEQRMGNKKVTLVQNLEPFFIRPQKFADLIRKKAQASTSVTPLPGSKATEPLQQILIQGNQVRNVEAILTGDHFKLPRKYITGLDQAPKAKGNKRK